MAPQYDNYSPEKTISKHRVGLYFKILLTYKIEQKYIDFISKLNQRKQKITYRGIYRHLVTTYTNKVIKVACSTRPGESL